MLCNNTGEAAGIYNSATRYDTYFNPNAISESNILHEGLHSLLKEGDDALATKLCVTIDVQIGTQPISDALHDNDCGG